MFFLLPFLCFDIMGRKLQLRINIKTSTKILEAFCNGRALASSMERMEVGLREREEYEVNVDEIHI